jgi:hypothetical protein
MGTNDDDVRTQSVTEGNDSNTDEHDGTDVGNNTEQQPGVAVPPEASHPLDTISGTACPQSKLTICHQNMEDSILCDML